MKHRRTLAQIAAVALFVCVRVIGASASPLGFVGLNKGDRLGSRVSCSEASTGSDRRSMIAAIAQGSSSTRSSLVIYDPETPHAKPQTFRVGARGGACRVGSALSFVPDFNGDGIDDLVLGAVCESDGIERRILVLRSIRKGPSIRYSLCGSSLHEAGIMGIDRRATTTTIKGFAAYHATTSGGTRYQVSMVSSRECSIAGTEGLSPQEVAAARAGARSSRSRCQAHVKGRLRSMEVRGSPNANDGSGAVEVRYKTLQFAEAAVDSQTPSLVTEEASGGAAEDPSGGADNGLGRNPGSSQGGNSDAGSGGKVGQQSTYDIAPGSVGLPAPEVDQSRGPNAYVVLPRVSVSLSESQKTRAVKLLMNRGSSKQRAELAVANPRNFVTTYVVTVLTERAGVAAAAMTLKSSAISSRAASKMRKYRTRRDRVSIGRLNSGSTVSISFRVEISLKKPRAVLGLTKPSETKRVRVP